MTKQTSHRAVAMMPDEDYLWSDAAYAHRLRVTRIALNITEAEAAEAHGVRLATYRKWEAGGRPHSIGPMLRFMEKFDVSADWLVAGEGFGIRSHLTTGKVAILPFTGPHRRRSLAQWGQP